MKLTNMHHLSARLAPLGLCGLVALGLTGCYKVQVNANPSVARGVESSKTVNFFIFGLVGQPTLDVRDFCGGGEAATVQTSATFINGLLGGITFGLWTPRTVTVSCTAGKAAGRSATITADVDGHPVSVESTVAGHTVRVPVSPTPELGVVMASLPSQESY
jgi:hypothetical protein